MFGNTYQGVQRQGLRSSAVLGTSGQITVTDNGDGTITLSLATGLDALVYKGAIDCGTNPNYPAADAGHVYVVSVAGKIGGASGEVVAAGDLILCKVDGSPSGTQAAVGANWDILENQDLTSDASPTFAGVTITGPAALGYSTITSSGTAAEYTTYFLDATSGEVILTLPAAATYAKRIYHIVRVQAAPSAYNCIVACQSGEYINGVGSAALENNYDRITVQSNGTGWIIIGR